MPDAPQTWVCPLGTRNASPAMQAIWSPAAKFGNWRRLWLALAESQQQLGLAITDAQLDALRAHQSDIDLDAAAGYEKQLRHDVMAHIHALGDQAPEARPIIHLGATSQFVVCNGELLQLRDALSLCCNKLAAAISRLGEFAAEHRDLPTLGFTHYQPAQPTTVGKRAALWAHDLSLALEELEHRRDTLRFRGVKGTTGTQASFLALFREAGHDAAEAHRRVEQLDELVAQRLDWPADRRFVVTGQTYPRVVDGMILGSLGAVAAAAAKFATDVRLLANRKELEEPFGAAQVGSSAMPYKRNPMRSERICGLSRFVISLVQAGYTTAAEQWLERSLDDSSARRLIVPEPFLALDGVLDLLVDVAGGLVVYPATVRANLMAELPFMASENLLMAAVSRGQDRQTVHELIRTHSQAAGDRVKREGASNDLIDRLRGEPAFEGVDLDAALEPAAYVGRAPEQVDAFVKQVVTPIRERYPDAAGYEATLKV
jgi:adenylosuccinate lyase